VEPALHRHHTLGRNVAGLDLEHRVCSLGQYGLDMADQQLAVRVMPVELVGRSLEPRRRGRGIAEDQLDLREAQFSAAQQSDQPASVDVVLVVAAVARVGVDARRAQ
jgi:hypothetical protein